MITLAKIRFTRCHFVIATKTSNSQLRRNWTIKYAEIRHV